MDGRRGRWADAWCACLTGVAVWALAWFSGNNAEIPPELWEDIAVAAGIRPTAVEFPALWRHALSIFAGAFGLPACLAALKVLGPVSLGILAAMAYGIFSGCLPDVLRVDLRRLSPGRWTARLIALQGAVFWACSDPLWRAGRVFSPEMLNVLLTGAALLSVRMAVCRSSLVGVVLTGVLSGVLVAETPLGALVPGLCCLLLARRCFGPVADAPGALANPIVFTVAIRCMGGAFVVCWVLTAGANLSFFRASCGLAGSGVFSAAVGYLAHYFRVVAAAATPVGWLLIASVIVLPTLIVAMGLRRLTDVERIPPMPYLCFTALAGFLAVLQLSDFAGCRFWEWDPASVRSDALLSVCMFLSAQAFVHAFSVFAVDVFYRNQARLLREMFPDASADEPLAVWVMRVLQRMARAMRRPLKWAPLFVLAMVVPFKFANPAHEMAFLVNRIAALTAEACGDAPRLITDGSYDAAVEVASVLAGRNVKALSMMSGSGRHDQALRLRGETGAENGDLLRAGTAEALRTWVREGRSEASNLAIQVGMELWRHGAGTRPQVGGLVARTAGFPPGTVAKHIDAARQVAERMLSLCERHDVEKCGYPQLRRFFHFGQWRLARMCRLRANEADGRHDEETSRRELQLAERLDGSNPQWRDVRERMTWVNGQGGLRLTPREGLKLALDRADFKMARLYAERVLARDEGDLEANFALAMAHFKAGNYRVSETHLKRYLVRRPDEPAVLNNLAVVLLRLGRLDEAETNALKALERLGDATEVKTTLGHIRAAKKRKGQGK